MSNAARSRTLRRALRWLEREGATLSPISFRADRRGGYQVHAHSDAVEGQLLFDVPLRCIITTEVARASAIGRAIAASDANLLSPHTFLAAFLLEERRAASSFWRPYLDVLPDSFPHSPLFFSEEELALLEGSMALQTIRARRQELLSEYEDLVEHLNGFSAFDVREYVWARMVVLTRAFALTIFGEATIGMVPLADMLNHSANPEAHWTFDDARGAYVMTAETAIAAGTAIHDSYGDRSNSRLLITYGFCLDDNPHEEVSIPAEDFATPGEEPTAEAIALACERALQRFPTTIEEDDALLADKHLSANARNAILMRRGEKRLLLASLEHAHANA